MQRVRSALLVVAACVCALVVPAPVLAAPADASEGVVVVVPAGDGRVTYLLGASVGDGTFAWSRTSLVGVRRPLHVALGDVDGDGRDDIVAVVPEGGAWKYEVYRNRGDGRFRALPIGLVRSSKPIAMTVGRLPFNGADTIIAAERAVDGSVRYRYAFDEGGGEFTWFDTGIRRRETPLALRIGPLSFNSGGDLVIVERQPDGKALYLVAVGGSVLRATNLVDMTPPAGFDLFRGSMQDFADIGVIERTSRTSGRLMVGEWGGPRFYGWGFTNIQSRPLPIRFAMGDVDGDSDGDGVAVVRSGGSYRIAVMAADRASGDFGWRVSGPRWDQKPLFLDVGRVS